MRGHYESMAKVTVEHEGNTIEVDLPAGYLTPDEIKSGYIKRGSSELSDNYILKAEVDRRWVPRNKAADDPKVIEKVLATHGPDPTKDGTEALQAALDAERSKREAAEALAGSLGSTIRDRDVERAARGKRPT